MGEITTLIIQGGSLGLLAVVVVLVIVRVLPEERKSRQDQAASFLEALAEHEEGHRTEIKTILDAHKTAIAEVAANDRERFQLVVEMRGEMKRQTDMIADAFGMTEARAANANNKRG